MTKTEDIKATALIFAKCLKSEGAKDLEKGYSEFAFKGRYMGHQVNKVLIEPSKVAKFNEGKKYVIWIRVSSLMAGVLRVSAVKSKIIL